MSLLQSTCQLSTEAKMPALGVGTWLPEAYDAQDVVKHAISVGYRHIDCAAYYNHEHDVGRAIAESGVPRQELFITSKLWNTDHRPEDVPRALEKSLKDLQLDYLDLYLIHWPVTFHRGDFKLSHPNVDEMVDKSVDFRDTWRAMEDLLASGKVKAIGVSNFNIANLRKLLESARIVPAVNQVEMHPYLRQDKLLAFCREKGIHVTAYSPLGSQGAPLIKEPSIQQVAEKHSCTPAQVLINWGVCRGTSVLSESTEHKHIEDNIKQVSLDKEDMEAIGKIDKCVRYSQWKWTEGIFEDDA